MERKSLKKIGESFGVSQNPIKRILLENGVKIRSSAESNIIDLQGQTFGKLNVIGLDPNHESKSGKHAYWLCKCECGKEVLVAGHHLRAGEVSACSPSCKHLITTGTRFGCLEVLAPTNDRSKNGGAVMYQCICSCGQNVLVSSTELRARRKNSCDFCTESIGETAVRQLLESNNISFE